MPFYFPKGSQALSLIRSILTERVAMGSLTWDELAEMIRVQVVLAGHSCDVGQPGEFMAYETWLFERPQGTAEQKVLGLGIQWQSLSSEVPELPEIIEAGSFYGKLASRLGFRLDLTGGHDRESVVDANMESGEPLEHSGDLEDENMMSGELLRGGSGGAENEDWADNTQDSWKRRALMWREIALNVCVEEELWTILEDLTVSELECFGQFLLQRRRVTG